jgi:NADPH:quinone reductase-like Zn-dependent oxidoreductase
MFAPVTYYDRFKKEGESGSEGSGIIESVGSGVDKELKGRKVLFCKGGWS